MHQEFLTTSVCLSFPLSLCTPHSFFSDRTYTVDNQCLEIYKQLVLNMEHYFPLAYMTCKSKRILDFKANALNDIFTRLSITQCLNMLLHLNCVKTQC